MKSLAASLIVGILVGAQLSLYNVPPLVWLPVVLTLVVCARLVQRLKLSVTMLYVAVALVGVMRLTQDVNALETKLLYAGEETAMEQYQHDAGEFRKSLLTPFFDTSEETSGAVANAMILGDKSGITKALRQTYSDSGAAHVIALSGMHLAIISAILFFLIMKVPLYLRFLPRYAMQIYFRRLKKNGDMEPADFVRKLAWTLPGKQNNIFRHLAVVAVLLTLWAYTFLVGMSPSVVRASTMLTIVSIATMLERKVSLSQSLAIAAFVILLVSPLSLFDAGFQMSFLAVLGIALYFLRFKHLAYRRLFPRSVKMLSATLAVIRAEAGPEPLRNRRKVLCVMNALKLGERVLKLLASCVCLTISAQVLVMPLVAYYFHQLPTYGIVTSIVVAFTATVIVWCGAVLLLVSLLGTMLPQLVATTSAFYTFFVHPLSVLLTTFIDLQDTILASVASMPYAVVRCPSLSMAQLIIIYIIIASLSFILSHCIKKPK